MRKTMKKPYHKYKDQHLKNTKDAIKKIAKNSMKKSLLKASKLKILKTKIGSNTGRHISHIAYRSSSKKGKRSDGETSRVSQPT
tara:strand:- start:3495 stop:3746 length:252 start_codon:yes stop_codon:yes gene_type:complete